MRHVEYIFDVSDDEGCFACVFVSNYNNFEVDFGEKTEGNWRAKLHCI